MGTLKSVFEDVFQGALKEGGIGKIETTITEHNVYQQGSEQLLPFLDQIVQSLVLPGSGVDGMENLEELLDKAQEGKSCLLLLEHYSNMDLSLFSWLVRQAGGRGKEIDKALVAIAGMKLNEESPIVATMASAYTRLVIYPSRSVEGLDPEKNRVEILRSNAINRAAMKTLLQIKTQKKIILVFPSGTRYRPWDPATKKGVREIDSYIRSFDYMCCVALNGEVLHVHRGDMLEDPVSRDLVRISAGKVQSCAEFREQTRIAAEAAGVEDKKQAAVNAVMEELEKMHIAAEEKRRKLLAALPPAGL
ncbi:MAG: 1-acyl-sn-glycerol-3-phosphate acyltransferase [Treponema sp.]|jgi:glycerol-3-phosphate O-acyltransferase|nr:1-acyl-sn-glycerol-3-phosphate acyltransferase [Treponema sp.]